MIRYALKCTNDHSFESWFQGASAFDTLKASGMVACPICASTDVKKAIMAPRVRTARGAAEQQMTEQQLNQATAPTAPAANTGGALSNPASPAEKALAELKKKVEANSEYVGMNFASEARAMHEGDTPERPIYGEAKLEEAKSLIEDGVPVAPLPFAPTRKIN